MKLVFGRLSRVGLAGVLMTAASASHGQTVTVVPKLDVSRFTGTWYEVARYPSKREKNCVGDVIELIAVGDKPGRLQLVNSCKTKDGFIDARNGSGKMDKAGDGKLKVSYTFPFSTKYWVLAVSPDYAWSLMGSPNHKSLWVLSRTPELSSDVLAEIEAKAAADGFPSARLMMATRLGQ